MRFKVGDVVTCVLPDSFEALTKGKQYTVTFVHQFGALDERRLIQVINNNGVEGDYYAKRFQLSALSLCEELLCVAS